VLRESLGVQMRPLTVRLTTLDALIARHGMPDFVKIDVEGFEAQVLAGLTRRPAALSFEFHGSLLDVLASCIDSLPGYKFRIAAGNRPEWITPWCEADEIVRRAGRLAEGRPELFADVYAVNNDELDLAAEKSARAEA
jgi:hypothetical protein